jgi:hypothetical protein
MPPYRAKSIKPGAYPVFFVPTVFSSKQLRRENAREKAFDGGAQLQTFLNLISETPTPEDEQSV